MCGIIGLFGEGVNSWVGGKKDFIIEGLIADSVRGYESTGIALLPRTKNDEVKIYKRDLAGYDFVQQKHTNRLIDQLPQSIGIIGHNRSATKGAVNDRNAHPFKHGHITLVHNGTVSNAEFLVDKKERPDGIAVDSDYVAHALSMEDAEDVLPRLTGGYSLVWFNSEERSLNFARNDQKPMFLAFDTADETVYFGSEAELLVWLCSRKHLTIQNEICRLTPNIHYVIKDPKNVKEIAKFPFAKGQYPIIPHKGTGNTGHTHRPTPMIPPSVSGNQWHPSVPTTETGTERGSNKGSETPTTTDGDSLQRSSKGKSTNDGTKSAYERESLSQGDVSGMRKNAKGKRLSELHTILEKHHLKPTTIVAEAIQWFAYNTPQGEQVNKNGWLVAQSTNPEAKGLVLQVFHVSQKDWKKKYEGSMLFLEAINFRKNMTPDRVVCRIREDLQQKHDKGGKDRRDREKKEGTSFGLVDSGTKENWIEIGTTRKRCVHPLEYLELVRHGCYNCNDPLPDDRDQFMWIGVNDDKPVCLKCCANPMILEGLQYVQ